MVRPSDNQLVLEGIEVGVEKFEYLKNFKGELKVKLSRPLSNWYLDEYPLNPVPEGYVPIRQLFSGCLACVKEEHILSWGVAGDPSELAERLACIGR